MTYKLKPAHKRAIVAADTEALSAGLPTYSTLVELVVKLMQNQSSRELARTVANCKEMVDIHTAARAALEPFRPGN